MVKVPRLTVRAKLVRRHWAQKHINRPLGQWQHVIFCDESRFILFRIYNRIRVRRLVLEAMNEDFTHGNVANGGGSVHLWGGISHMWKTSFVRSGSDVTGAVYHRILEEHLIPNGRAWYRNNWPLADDDPPSGSCSGWLPPWTRHHLHGLGPLSSGYELNRTYLERKWSWFGGIVPSVSEPEATWSCSPTYMATDSSWLVGCHAESVL